jgi:cell division protein FtsX
MTMQIDELRSELTSLADEIEPFAGDAATLHHRQRRRHLVISSLVVAVAVVVASSVAVMHNRAGDRVRISGAGSKEVAAADITHVDVIVVPATPALQQALDTSPLVVRYALVPRGLRMSAPSLLVTTRVRGAMCSLESRDGYAVQTTTVAGVDAPLLLGPTVASETVHDVSDTYGFDLEIFLGVDTPTTQVNSVRVALTSDPAIASFRYVSQGDAYDIFKREFADQPSIVQGTKPSDLPPSFRIDLTPNAPRQSTIERYQQLRPVATVISHNVSEILAPTTSLSVSAFRNALASTTTRSETEIFLSAGATRRQVDAVRNALATDADIRSSRFIDQNEAYSIFASEFADQPDLVRGTKPSDLPASFRIDVKAGRSVAAAASRYRNFDGVMTVIAPQDALPVSACAKP